MFMLTLYRRLAVFWKDSSCYSNRIVRIASVGSATLNTVLGLGISFKSGKITDCSTGGSRMCAKLSQNRGTIRRVTTLFLHTKKEWSQK